MIPFPEGGRRGYEERRQREAAADKVADTEARLDDLRASVEEVAAFRAMAAPRPPRVGPPPATEVLLTVHVELEDTRPAVWRRLVLPGDVTLDRLHALLQVAMGWTDSHLHAFALGPGERDHGVASFATAYDLEEGDDPDPVPEAGVRVDQVLREVGDRLYYDYDFGDGWSHVLRLEEVAPLDGDAPGAARCLGGERACPVEDVGGPYAWNDLAAHLEGREPQEGVFGEDSLATRAAWLPDDLDPAFFDAAGVDAALRGTPLGDPFAVLRDPDVVVLVERLGGLPAALALAATLAGPAAAPDATEPTTQEKARLMHPFQVLLEVVGEHGAAGAPLTPAGWLRPALVQRIFEQTVPEGRRFGKGNREDVTPDVRNLRDAATVLRLVRKHRDHLVLTPLGRRVLGDTDALWDAVAHALPLGKEPVERDVGVLLLMSWTHPDPRTAFRELCPPLAWLAGWRRSDGRPVEAEDLVGWTLPTIRLQGVLDPYYYRPSRSDLHPLVAALARAALRT